MWFLKVAADIFGSLAAMVLAPIVCAFAGVFLVARKDWPLDLSRSPWGMPAFHISLRKLG